MPKRTDLQSILILGSGPIVIGQAVRTLREEAMDLLVAEGVLEFGDDLREASRVAAHQESRWLT